MYLFHTLHITLLLCAFIYMLLGKDFNILTSKKKITWYLLDLYSHFPLGTHLLSIILPIFFSTIL